jgi:tetratricopeptide (TPR) repeat protein
MRHRFVPLVLGGLATPGLALAQAPPAAPPVGSPAAPAGTAVTPVAAPSMPPAAPAGNAAVALLVRQGQHWLDEGRPELAALSVARALSAEPNNINALLLGARVEAARGNRSASSAYAGRLRGAGATPEQQAIADSILHEASIDPAALEAARQLARGGHLDEAAARYQSLFGQGEPPPAYAREYYQVLASADSTRALGQRGLARLAARPDADDRTLLAHAEALTYTTSTRADGIARLAALTARPIVGAQAQAAWKQALGFYGQDPAVSPLLGAYLQRFPGDADIMRQQEAVRTAQPAPPGPTDLLSQGAFAALNSGALSASETQFTQLLAANPANADALGGLGIVRLRQNRPADAEDLLQRAIAAAPDRAAQWQRALDAASYTLELANARVLLRGGDAAGADAVLRQAVGRDVDDKTDAESMLGESALRRGDAQEAEQHFRAALARRPGFAPSVAGLNRALRAQGRLAEAPEPPSSYAPARGGGGGAVSTAATSHARAEAAQTSDPSTQVALLSNAMTAAPNDPWLRLDLARALRRLGRGAEGRALMEELVARQSTPDTLYAAALLAQEDGRPADAQALLGRIPPARTNPDMARLQARLRQQQDVASAAALLSTTPIEARQRLLTLAARPDPTGGTAADVIRALGNAGDRVGADQAGRTAELANPQPSARIAIAGALLAAGLNASATAMAARLDNSRLTDSQRRDLAALRIGADVRVSDRLNESGDQAAAFERLRPALASAPDNPDVQLALARLYQGARQPAEAMRIAEAVLARNPGNIDARRGAVDAAIAAGDRRHAQALADEGAAITPGDSRATLLQAHVARAYNDNTRARALLDDAAAQRQAELGTAPDTGAVASAPVLPNPFASSGSAALAPGGAAPQDAVAREIAQQQASLQDDTARRASADITVRSRSGTAGLDQLEDISVPVEASFTPGSIDGRIIAHATPVLLDNGTLSGAANILRFGSNAGSGTTALPSTKTATGIALDVAYQRSGLLTIDAGASPLGFPVSNVVGGIEVAPKLTDQVTLRLRAERRVVTDSLLSYAGERDPVTGATWGGVTRNEGHGQIETGLGAGNVYAGGGYAVYTGQHVAQNNEVEAGTGFSYPLYKQGDSTLLSGLDLVYFRFDNNQRAFTLGQGGYFSPQNFVQLNVPVDYRSTWGDLQYHLRGTAGYASFREEGSPLYPLDPGLQAAAEAAAALNPDIPSHNQAQNKSGIVGGVRVDLRYPLNDRLTLYGGLAYDQAPQWQETSVSVRLENRF